MLYVGENRQRKSGIALKKSIIFSLAENILFSGVQFKIRLFIFLSFLSRLHMNFLCSRQHLWIWTKHEKLEGYGQASKNPLPNGMAKRPCDLLLLARWCPGTKSRKHLRAFFLKKIVLALSTSSDSLNHCLNDHILIQMPWFKCTFQRAVLFLGV